MKRRTFLKLFAYCSSAILMPRYTYASQLELKKIDFSQTNYENNNAQTIIVFMYGGPSPLAGNLTNFNDIKKASLNSYNGYFGDIDITTPNGCWLQAGGKTMESLIASGDMTICRNIYSQKRDKKNIRAHGLCTQEVQKGTFDENAGGILSNLAQILESNNVINEDTMLPFITMDGESNFYATGYIPISDYLKPVGIDEHFNNPYFRNVRTWYYYTKEERKISNYNDQKKGFDPELDSKMNKLAQSYNTDKKIKDAFSKRKELSDFIIKVSTTKTPDLGDNSYPKNSISPKLETAVKLLVNNPDTKVVTINTGGLGGWDDHNDAKDYIGRTRDLFASLKSAIAHIKAEDKIDSINIMVFGEFGRNVNLNSANGWDHGNLQNLYVLGGKGYFKHKGVIGETILDVDIPQQRLWLKPKSTWYEHTSIAATLYKIYGIKNPEIICDNSKEIQELFS